MASEERIPGSYDHGIRESCNPSNPIVSIGPMILSTLCDSIVPIDPSDLTDPINLIILTGSRDSLHPMNPY